MEKLTFKNDRDRWSYEEATRDPIFLIQSRELVCTRLPYNYVWDDEGYLVPEDCFESTEDEMEDFVRYSSEEAYEAGLGEWQVVWITHSVWYSREEAELHRTRRLYHFGKSSRVYCICAEGELARILKEYGDRTAPIEDNGVAG